MILRKLGRWHATALAVSFVVGSGILVLPILSLQMAGPAVSFQAWVLMSVIGIPLVRVFYSVSSTQDFTLTRCFTEVFGECASVGAQVTIAAALLLGMPAMIYTAASVIIPLLGMDSSGTGWISHLILTLLCLNHLRPIHQSTQISIYSALLLIFLILAVVVTHPSDLQSGLRVGSANFPRINGLFLRAGTLSFFGYVGWESLGFFVHELRDAKRDLKWVFGTSFVLVSILYLTLAAVVSGANSRGQVFTLNEGILSLLPAGVFKIASIIMVAFLLLANLNAWVFGGSQQVHELLKARAYTKNAVLFVYYLAVSFLLLFLDFKKLSIADFFLLSNQNWIVIYGGILVFYRSIAKTWVQRGIGWLGLASFGFLSAGCSRWILLNFLLFGLCYLREVFWRGSKLGFGLNS